MPRRGRPPIIATRTELRVSVPAELKERLRAAAIVADVSDAAIVREALEVELAKREGSSQ